MKYVIYSRKSSEAEDRQILSIDSQVNELKDQAKKLRVDIIEVYSESKSAKSPGRDVFKAMMERIYTGEVKGILCWKLDRLARNAVDGGAIIWAVNELGLEIITPSKTFTKEDSLMMYVEFGMANQFINDLSKNVKRGLKTKAEKGWLPSGAKPGYMNDKYAEKGNKTIFKDPERFPLISKAWEMMLTGQYSPPFILNKLNNEWGYRTPKHKRIGGKPMSRSMIYKVFSDPFYYGEFEYGGVWYKGKHESMITKEDFNKVQIFLGKKGKLKLTKHSFDFIGLMTCGECRASITAEEKWQIICPNCKLKFHSVNKEACPSCETKIEEMKSPKILHYIFYHCTKRKDPNCTQGSLEVKKLEKQVDEILSRIEISDKFKNWAIKYLNEVNDVETGDRNAILGSLQSAYSDCIKRIDNLVKLKISPQNSDGNLLSDEEYKNEKDELIKEKKSLEDKLNDTGYRIDKWIELSEKTFEFATHARYWFAIGDNLTKRQVFQGLGQNLILKDKVLLPELDKPLLFIEKIKQIIPEVSPGLEPEEKLDFMIKSGISHPQTGAMLRD